MARMFVLRFRRAWRYAVSAQIFAMDEETSLGRGIDFYNVYVLRKSVCVAGLPMRVICAG